MIPIFFNKDSQLTDLILFLATIAAASIKLTPPLQDTFKGLIQSEDHYQIWKSTKNS